MSKNKTKAELLAELDSYRSFVESIDASLCRWLPDTTLVFANEKYKRIFGVQGDAVGQKWINFLPEEMRAATAAFYSEVTKAPRPVHYEHPATAEDGSVREFHWTDTPILDENGRVVEFHSVGIDITERKRAEQILMENSARTKELLEATPDAMVIVDADGKILMVNARTEAMFGYAQHELLGAAVEILMPKELRERHLDNRAEFMARLNSVIAGGEQNIVAERKDGEIFPAEISISKHKLAGNEIVTLCAIRDVTERQRARELIIAQRDLAKMLSSDVSDVQLWETALQCAIRAAHLDSGGIYLFDEESHAFTLVYQEGLGAEFVAAVAQFGEDSPSTQMILFGKNIHFTEADLSVKRYHKDEGLRALMVIPIQHHGQVFGCLNVASHTLTSIPDWSRSVLETLAVEIGNIIIHRRTEAELTYSNTQLRQTLVAARMGSWRYYIATNRMIWSPEAAQILGTDQYEEDLSRIMEYFHPEDRGKAAQALEDMLAQKEIPNLEYRMFSVSGELLWVTNYGKLECDSDGNPIAISGLIQDITERKNMELALESEAVRRRILFEESPDGVLVIDMETSRFLDFNTKAHTQLGYTREEFSNLSIFDIEAQETKDETIEHINNVIRNGSADFETLQRTKQGELRNIHVTAQAVEITGQLAYYCIWRDITERKRAEEARRETDERYYLLFRNMAQGVVFQDKDGHIIHANPAAERILGLSIDQMMGRASVDPRWHSIYEDGSAFPGEDHPVMVALRTGTPVSDVVMGVFNPEDDTYRWININATPRFLNGGGEPYQVFATFEDITARKQAEDQLRESEARYRFIAENSADVIWVLDPNAGKFTYVSPSVEKLRGYTPEEVMAQPMNEALTPESLKMISESLKVNIPLFIAKGSGTASFISEVDQPCKDGSIVNTEVTTTYLFNEQGNMEIVGVSRNITERKQAEEARRESDERYHLLFEGMTQGVAFQDDEGRLLHANPAAEKIMGITLEEMRGHTAIYPGWHMMREDGTALPAEEHPSALVLRSGLPVNNIVMGVFSPKKETYIWLNINSFPRFKDGNSKPYQVFTTFEDITARKQAELELRESEERLRSMLEISQAMSASLEMDTVLQKIVENAAGLLELESGAIYTLQGDTLYLEATTPPLPAELPDELRHANVTDHPHIHAAISSGSAVVLADTTSVELSDAEKMIVQARGLRSIVYVPLMISEKAIGVLIMASVDRLRTFSAEEIALYSGFSGQAAQTIENIRLYRSEREYAAELELQITERKQAEEALRVTELRNQALIENAPDGIALFNENGRFTFASLSAYRMTGYTPEEIIGQKAHKLIHPEDKERMTAGFINLLRQPAQPVVMQYRFKHKEGDYRWIEGTFTNLMADPAIHAVVENFSDITERKQAEETLRESEKKYRDLINGMNDTVWVIDLDTHFLDVNDAAVRALGYSREELLSKKVSDVDAVIQPQQIQQLIDTLAEKKLQVFETCHKARDGMEIPVEVSSSLISYNGRTVIMSIARDITERKKAEQEIFFAEQRYRALIENATDGIVLIGADAKFKYASPSVKKIFGYNQDEVLTGNPNELTHPEDLPKVLREMEKLLQDPSYTPTLQYRFRHKNGEWRWIESTFSNLTSLPSVEAVIINFRDIQERKEAEDALHKSQSLLKEAQRISRIGHMEWSGRDQRLICSDEVYDILNLPHGTVISQEMIGQMMSAGERERLQQLDMLAMQQRGDMSYEFSIRTPDGDIRWLHQTGKVAYDENGIPTRMMAILQDITERKKAENILRESATRLEMAIKGAKAGMWDWNVQTGELVINPRWAEIIGYSLKELEPVSIKTWENFCHPDDLKRSEALLQKHFAGEIKFYECEIRMKHKDGSWVWVVDQGKVMEWDEDGKPVRMFGTHLDITKQKHEELYTQAVLRLTNLSYETLDTEQLMRTMLDEAEALTDSAIGFFHFVDDDQNTIRLQAWSTNTLANLCKAEGQGQHYPVEQAGVWADAIRSGEPCVYNDYLSLENRKGLPDGHAPVSRLISLPVKRNNLVVAVLGVGNKPRDYTEQDLDVLRRLAEMVFDFIMRERAEEALRKNEERLRTVADFTYDMEFWIDENKALQYMSPSCERITGYKREKFLQDPSLLQRIVHPDDRPVFDQHDMEEFDLPDSRSLVFRVITAEGEVRWVSHTCQAVTGADGTFRGRRVSHRDVTERRHVLQELRASEEKYRGLVKSLTNSISVLDFDGNFLYLNDTAAADFGSTPQDVIGRNLRDLFPEPFASMQMKDIQNVFNLDREFVYESQSKIRNEVRWYRVSLQPLHNESGEVKQVLVNATDIHDLKTAQQELQELNQTLEEKVAQRTTEVRDLYENAPTGYHSLDVEGKFIMINQTELNWLGYAREEMIGRPFIDFITPESLNLFKFTFPELKERGWVKDIDFELIRKDGTILPVLLSATAIYDEAGNFVMSRSTIFDNTERKQAETAIRESEETYRALFENSNDGIFLLSAAGEELRANQRALDMVGYTLAEFLTLGELKQKPFTSEAHQRQDADDKLEALLRGENVPLYERVFTAKDGRQVPVEINLSPVRDTNGKIIMVQSVVRDITERKRSEETLRRANMELERAMRMKDEFLATMSHELRTPLTGILGLSEAMQMEAYGSLTTRQSRTIKNIEESGRHLLALINDVLDLSKIEAGKLTLDVERYSLHDICQASLQLTKGMAHQKKQHVNFSMPIDPIFLEVDMRRLKQILVNLLSNAIKFTPENGELGLAVEADEQSRQVRLAVWDKGIGIKSEHLSTLFTPFSQIDSSLAREYSGTGLGLALVKKLVELHHGSVGVTSVPGEGSRFTVTLPWAPEIPPTPASETEDEGRTSSVQTGQNPSAPMIFIADDNRVLLDMMGDFLELNQYRTLRVQSGRELLEKIESVKPDAILMDIQMPGMDGLEAIRRVRSHANSAIASTPIIAVTALAMNTDRARCLEAGANEYLSKPLKLKSLVNILDRLLAPIK